jgi:hypothetical protein
MYFDKPVTVPKSLQGIAGVETSNAHRTGAPMGFECEAILDDFRVDLIYIYYHQKNFCIACDYL